MNKERILEIAEKIDAADRAAFNMGKFHTESSPVSCGTPGCIAGWVCSIYAPDVYSRSPLAHQPLADAIAQRARHELDLSESQANVLFLGDGIHKELSLVTPAEAANALRTLARDGILPSWPVMLEVFKLKPGESSLSPGWWWKRAFDDIDTAEGPFKTKEEAEQNAEESTS